MTAPLDWTRDGTDWPNREASRFVAASGLRWHVQLMGEGPVCLLLHGTGSATHSWRDLAPLLATRFTVLSLDLPGHGFTEPLPARRLSLPGMAAAIGELLAHLELRPALAVGHSAGAALLARMALDGLIDTPSIVRFNGALRGFRGPAQLFFAPLAKMLVLNPLAPRLFAASATPASVDRMLRHTGSALDRQGVALYTRLLRNPGHVAGALGMMAGWDLADLERDIPRLAARLLLVAGSDDRAVPPDDAFAVKERVPGAEVVFRRKCGHLLHEEQPQAAAEIVFAAVA